MMSFLFRLTCFRQLWFSKQLLLLLSLVCIAEMGNASSDCEKVPCVHGSCVTGSCVCEQGWQGVNCDLCGGRRRLSEKQGFITDGPGNYSSNIRCIWLIKINEEKGPIVLKLEQFETECGWDHLYIHDGDSMQAPLLAVYSGVVVRDDGAIEQKPQVIASSGSAFIYFISDGSYNMAGFNISYRINSSPENCMGVCLENGSCVINNSRTISTGSNIAKHSTNCSSGHHISSQQERICSPGYKGLNCSQLERNGYWTSIKGKNSMIGLTSHQAFVYNGYMWIFGGNSFSTAEYQIMTYRFSTSMWDPVSPLGSYRPYARYGHTVVEYKGKAYMFAGLVINNGVVNEVSVFNFANSTWRLLTLPNKSCSAEPCPPLAVVGHTANVVDNTMLIIFGHSPIYGYLDIIQEYNFDKQEWRILNTTGIIVKGGYGHTSIFDPITGMIFVYGGYRSSSWSTYTLSDDLYAFQPRRKLWLLYSPSKSPRYLHSAAIVNRLMFVFGGNARNRSSVNDQDNCYSSDFLVYDIHCDLWYKLPAPTVNADVTRVGHSAVVHNGSIYIFGGFNGRMLNNVLVYTPPTCGSYTSNSSCIAFHPGVKCIWTNSLCTIFQSERDILKTKCTHRNADDYGLLCKSQKSCTNCVNNSYDCVWCGRVCSYQTCKRNSTPIKKNEECDSDLTKRCHRLHNCHSCQTLDDCIWDEDLGCDNDFFPGNDSTEPPVVRGTCPISCSQKKTCAACTEGPCLWCESEKRCVDSNAYSVSFLYGRCLEWINLQKKCPITKCSDISTCEKCQENPTCGWCQGSSADHGVCLLRTRGVSSETDFTRFINDRHCSSSDWQITNCPTCNCNGHGTCDKKTSTCYCTTKGIIGSNCEKCDEHNYIGNPQYGGTCFYNLTSDVEFAVSLSEPQDLNYRQMNFKHVLHEIDRDVEFFLSCSNSVFINVTVGTETHPEKFLINNYQCKDFRTKFSPSNFSFCGAETITFYVYAFDLKPPLCIQVSFSQPSPVTLTKSFSPVVIICSSCFVIVLIVGIILWKFKLKYNTCWCRRWQTDDLASRPFATVSVETIDDLQRISDVTKWHKSRTEF